MHSETITRSSRIINFICMLKILHPRTVLEYFVSCHTGSLSGRCCLRHHQSWPKCIHLYLETYAFSITIGACVRAIYKFYWTISVSSSGNWLIYVLNEISWFHQIRNYLFSRLGLRTCITGIPKIGIDLAATSKSMISWIGFQRTLSNCAASPNTPSKAR